MSEENAPDQTPGTICWNEIITSDKSASMEFYSNLMGWTSEDMELPEGQTYTMFMQGEKMIAGCISPEGGNISPMWLSYILVEDLDSTAAKAVSLGGNILMERVDLPMGSFVIIADPQGAVIAFWQSSGAEC